MKRERLTDGQQRNPLAAVVARDAVGFGVEHGFAIHHEEVWVMSMVEFQAGHPATVGHPVHGSGEIPPIEIADEADVFGPWRVAEEIRVMARPFCGIARQRHGRAGFTGRGVHWLGLRPR